MNRYEKRGQFKLKSTLIFQKNNKKTFSIVFFS
jgi:hypothetical protein